MASVHHSTVDHPPNKEFHHQETMSSSLRYIAVLSATMPSKRDLFVPCLSFWETHSLVFKQSFLCCLSFAVAGLLISSRHSLFPHIQPVTAANLSYRSNLESTNAASQQYRKRSHRPNQHSEIP